MSNFLAFDKFIIRTPLLPIDAISGINNSKDLKKVIDNQIILEAIYLASPEFFFEIEKYLNGTIKNKERIDRIEHSVFKYLTRMSNRCTPFGLFSGCGVGEIGDKNKIRLNEIQDYKRKTRLDMNYLCQLAQVIEENNEIKKKLTYFTNSSIYKVWNKLRFVEYHFKNSNRKHFVVSIDFSEYIEKVLLMARGGAKVYDLVNILTELDDEINRDEAEEFVFELIKNQVLISEIAPTVSGGDNFDRIISPLPQYMDWAQNIKYKLNKIDCLKKKSKSFYKEYEEASDLLTFFDKDYDKKYLFQTDLFLSFKENKISASVVKDITKGINFLKKLARPNKYERIKDFKEAFYKRYEEEEIQLTTALDVETGIAYGTSSNAIYDVSPLIDDLNLFKTVKTSDYLETLKWTNIDALMYTKLIEAIKNKDLEIKLNNDDLIHLNVDSGDLPLTFSAICRIIYENDGSYKIHLETVGGNSAANLLGRFCYGNEQILDLVNDIVKKEKKENTIFPEIVHLSESSLGNILHRPVFREYEIPYLASSTLPMDNQININDIYVSIRDEKIVLRSKKEKKKIIPRLSNSHIVDFGSLPIYLFLSDLQSQNLCRSLSLSWGSLLTKEKVLPRISFENLILSTAQWILDKADINLLKDSVSVKMFFKKRNIPNKVLLADGDNELLIDLENKLSLSMFITILKKREIVTLKEYLFNSNNSLIQQGNKYFANEFIFSFYKND